MTCVSDACVGFSPSPMQTVAMWPDLITKDLSKCNIGRILSMYTLSLALLECCFKVVCEEFKCGLIEINRHTQEKEIQPSGSSQLSSLTQCKPLREPGQDQLKNFQLTHIMRKAKWFFTVIVCRAVYAVKYNWYNRLFSITAIYCLISPKTPRNFPDGCCSSCYFLFISLLFFFLKDFSKFSFPLTLQITIFMVPYLIHKSINVPNILLLRNITILSVK